MRRTQTGLVLGSADCLPTHGRSMGKYDWCSAMELEPASIENGFAQDRFGHPDVARICRLEVVVY